MPDVVFLIHGMGQFSKDWELPVVGQLRDFCDNYSKPGKGDFDERFQFIAINYSLIFKDILTTWANEKKDIDSLSAQVGADQVGKLVSWIADENSVEHNFFWSHAFDVITYRLLPTVRDAVQVRVAAQLFDGIKDLPDGSDWSIIAHSLGTAVCHDTLQAWFTQPLAGGGTLGQRTTPYLLQMIANVSRILQNQTNVFESDVRPGRACNFYFTQVHPLDPFTIIKTFLPTQWPGPPHPERYYVKTLEHDFIQQANIHDLAHYLRHPDIVIPLFRCLTFNTYVTQDLEAKYRSQFKLHGKLTDPELIALRQKLEDAGINIPDSWTALLTVWNRVEDLMSLAKGGVNGP
jgi:hypothetical protein